MPAGDRAVVKAITRYGPTVVKHAPGVLAFVAKFLQDHPALPARSRQQLDRVVERLRTLRPGDAEQIRGKIAIVRDEVASMDLPADVAAGWLARAANLEHGAHLASQLGSRERRKTLHGLREQADALLAEAIAVIAYTPPAEPERPAVRTTRPSDLGQDSGPSEASEGPES